MGFFDWFNRGRERQYDINAVNEYIRSLIEPEDNLQDMKTPVGIYKAFQQADILQSIELTVKDYSKNHKVYTIGSQKEVLNIGTNLKGQTFKDVYSEIIAEKVKYMVAVVRIIQGTFSGKQSIECLKLRECYFEFRAVQYPTILDLKYVEYRDVKYYPEELLFFGNTSVSLSATMVNKGLNTQ